MKTIIPILLMFMFFSSSCNSEDTSSVSKSADVLPDISYIDPIDWSRFTAEPIDDNHLRQSGRIMLNIARYNIGWIDKTFQFDPAKDIYVHTAMNESGIRPSCSASLALAAVLQTGIFDEKVVGISQHKARAKTAKLIKSVATVHKSNTPSGKGWGHSWQSRLWSALLGHAGWMLWDDLDGSARQMLVNQLVAEANTLLADEYKVPYWNSKGGDTKAEENAWNAMVVHVAVAMMPQHPNVSRWKKIGSELMISAYATKKDWKENATVLDGRVVKDWLNGYNAMDNGAVMNHNILHPDYMVAITMNLRAYVTQSLSGRGIPESSHFNSPLIFRTFATYNWPSPPYKKPGGTIYLPGKAGVYYPNGTDWSTYDYAQFYHIDSYAHILGWDKNLPHSASRWMNIRADEMLKMQSRHKDGRMFAKGEYDTYQGSEQWIAWCMTDAFLPLWLNAQNKLSKTANWLNETELKN